MAVFTYVPSWQRTRSDTGTGESVSQRPTRQVLAPWPTAPLDRDDTKAVLSLDGSSGPAGDGATLLPLDLPLERGIQFRDHISVGEAQSAGLWAGLRILYMEDDAGVARLIQKRLGRTGLVVDIAGDGEEGLAMCVPGAYDLLMVDQNMPTHDGLAVIRTLASREALPPTIMITGAGNEMIAVEAMKLGARDYIVKDVEGGYLELLPTVIARVFAQQRLIEEKRRAELERDATLQALREYALELEARNQELDAFAHTVAHDLKGPLSTDIGVCSLLRENWTDLSTEQINKLLDMVVRAAHKMHNIIEELLLLASVRKEAVEVTQVEMKNVVAETQERLAHLITEYEAEVIMPDTWPVVLGYGPWIEEVWTNYLSNAISYGGRPPRVELGATQEANGTVRFWVRDNGPGLTPAEQRRLFTPFTRLEQASTKGHGLGLSIVRRIVEKLGGQVEVESEIGQGSVFSFTLPTFIRAGQ